MSTKSITRNISELKNFLADHRELTGNAELQYSYSDKCYRLHMERFLSSKELFSLLEVMIGTRAFSKTELTMLISKLKRFITPEERSKISGLISKEMLHYTEIKHDCESVQDNLWKIASCITEGKEISIGYFRMDRKWVTHRLIPASIMFADYYFYLIAFRVGEPADKPFYFRIDRIEQITVHRTCSGKAERCGFDEGLLRRRSLFMWPGKLRTIRFQFSGPSVQAVLDKLPTARIIKRQENNKYLIEAEVYGDGIKMWLLSQGSWVKVISPSEFVDEIKAEIKKMADSYNE